MRRTIPQSVCFVWALAGAPALVHAQPVRFVPTPALPTPAALKDLSDRVRQLEDKMEAVKSENSQLKAQLASTAPKSGGMTRANGAANNPALEAMGDVTSAQVERLMGEVRELRQKNKELTARLDALQTAFNGHNHDLPLQYMNLGSLLSQPDFMRVTYLIPFVSVPYTQSGAYLQSQLEARKRASPSFNHTGKPEVAK